MMNLNSWESSNTGSKALEGNSIGGLVTGQGVDR